MLAICNASSAALAEQHQMQAVNTSLPDTCFLPGQHSLLTRTLATSFEACLFWAGTCRRIYKTLPGMLLSRNSPLKCRHSIKNRTGIAGHFTDAQVVLLTGYLGSGLAYIEDDYPACSILNEHCISKHLLWFQAKFVHGEHGFASACLAFLQKRNASTR